MLVPTWIMALAVVTLLPAGCGANATSARVGPRATATPTPTPHRPSPLAMHPCPGPPGSAFSAGSGVVILNSSSTSNTATAQLGQTVEIQLPTRDSLFSWAYGADMSRPAGLSLTQPAGISDGQRNLCIWNFTARSAGTATLGFTGQMICRPNRDCLQYLLLRTFTIHIV